MFTRMNLCFALLFRWRCVRVLFCLPPCIIRSVKSALVYWKCMASWNCSMCLLYAKTVFMTIKTRARTHTHTPPPWSAWSNQNKWTHSADFIHTNWLRCVESPICHNVFHLLLEHFSKVNFNVFRSVHLYFCCCLWWKIISIACCFLFVRSFYLFLSNFKVVWFVKHVFIIWWLKNKTSHSYPTCTKINNNNFFFRCVWQHITQRKFSFFLFYLINF